ncbi:MAG: SWIM zinc finger family protein, partial [Rhodanobacter sp.]
MDTHRLQELLDVHPWEAVFDERTLGRAAAYYHGNRVIALRHQPDSNTLLAAVRGSAHKPYNCAIHLVMQQHELRIISSCTCPVGTSCKHVMAVLMMATSTPSEFWPGAGALAPILTQVHGLTSLGPAPARDPLREWTQWLQSVDTRRTPEPTRVADADRQFGVLLRGADNNPAPRLLINLVWLRPSRSTSGSAAVGKALVDPQPLRLDPLHGPVPTPIGGWPAELVPALVTLLQEPHSNAVGQSWVSIHADYQEQALQSVLACYPAYHERGSNPLTRSADQPLQLHWQDNIDGSQRLVPHIAADTPSQLLRGRRLWFVQAKAHRYGLVEADAQWVEALMQIPVAQPEQVDALRKRLQDSNLAATLPPPVERGATQTISAAPVPVLQLRVIHTHRGRTGIPVALGCARLAFDYGPIRVPPGGYESTLRRLHEGQVYVVQRQHATEHAVETPLRRAGLVSIGWRPEDRGIPSRLVERDDLVLLGNPRQQPMAAGDWLGAIAELNA